jgi:hypothetical protein
MRLEAVMLPSVAPPVEVSAPQALTPVLSAPASRAADSPSSVSLPIAPAALVVAGLAGLGAGTYFGIQALHQKQQRDAWCSGGACSLPAFTYDGEARSSSLASTVAFGAGTAAIAAGAAWWALEGRPALSSRKRWVAPVVLGALGLAGVGTGTYLGLLTFSEKSLRNAQCSDGACAPGALSYDAQARMAATLSTLTFAAGGALVGGAATVWLTERGSFAPLQLALSPTRVTLRGAIR